MTTTTKLWICIAILILIAPLGLIIPAHFNAGSAWGEWGADEMHKLVGYVPSGMKRLSGLWKAPIADYVFKGWENKSLANLSIAYILSALIGIVFVAGLTAAIGKLLAGKKER